MRDLIFDAINSCASSFAYGKKLLFVIIL